MFKNLLIFKINPEWNQSIPEIEFALAADRFVECGSSQESSIGWIEPRGEKHGPLIESIGGQWIIKSLLESKVVPGSVVKEESAKKISQIERQTGRKPGKKEIKELREDIRLKLLPRAFPKKSGAIVWINPETRLLAMEASSQGRADEIITLLVKSLQGLSVTSLNTQQSPSACMATWLTTQEVPSPFSADQDCMLKASDQTKASVKYAKHPLDIEEIRDHIASGKVPTQLAMTWDDKVSFVLTEVMGIKKIEFLDGVFEGQAAADKDSGFDADVALSTGTLAPLITDLVEALGGLLD